MCIGSEAGSYLGLIDPPTQAREEAAKARSRDLERRALALVLIYMCVYIYLYIYMFFIYIYRGGCEGAVPRPRAPRFRPGTYIYVCICIFIYLYVYIYIYIEEAAKARSRDLERRAFALVREFTDYKTSVTTYGVWGATRAWSALTHHPLC